MISLLMRVWPISTRRRLQDSLNLQKVIDNISWLFADRILRLGVGLLVGVWVARFLGPEQYGLYSYAVAYVSLFLPLATLGLDSVVVREIVNDSASKDEILGTAFVVKFIGGGVASILAIAGVFLIRWADTDARDLVIIIASGMIFQAIQVIDLWFQSQIQSRYTVIVQSIVFALATITKIVLILTNAKVDAFAVVWLFEIVFSGIGLVPIYLWKKNQIRRWKFRTSRLRSLLRDSIPLALSGIAIMVYVRIDQVMLGQMLDDRTVGIYAAAARISEIWYFIPVGIVSSVSPIIIGLKQTNMDLYYSRLQSVFNIMAVISYGVAIPLTLLSDYIVQASFGSDYVVASSILRVHIWQGVFVFQGVARGIWIISDNHMKSALMTTSFGAILNILLNLWLIPILGPMGSAIATVISYSISDFFIFALVPYAPFQQISKMMIYSLTLQFLYRKGTMHYEA